jgi:DNA modification methylase
MGSVPHTAHMEAKIEGRSWFVIDGTLEPIEFHGPSSFRFPESLARLVIERFSRPNDIVLDPFCGFGTAVVAAQATGRIGLGIEKDAERFAFAASRVSAPSRIVHASASYVDTLDLPACDLIFTSPPYTSLRDWNEESFARYWDDFEAIFSRLASLLKPSGRLIVEMSNVRDDGSAHVRPVAFEAALRLGKRFDFLGEVVRCNAGGDVAGPGYEHSYLLAFGSTAAAADGGNP